MLEYVLPPKPLDDEYRYWIQWCKEEFNDSAFQCDALNLVRTPQGKLRVEIGYMIPEVTEGIEQFTSLL